MPAVQASRINTCGVSQPANLPVDNWRTLFHNTLQAIKQHLGCDMNSSESGLADAEHGASDVNDPDTVTIGGSVSHAITARAIQKFLSFPASWTRVMPVQLRELILSEWLNIRGEQSSPRKLETLFWCDLATAYCAEKSDFQATLHRGRLLFTWYRALVNPETFQSKNQHEYGLRWLQEYELIGDPRQIVGRPPLENGVKLLLLARKIDEICKQYEHEIRIPYLIAKIMSNNPVKPNVKINLTYSSRDALSSVAPDENLRIWPAGYKKVHANDDEGQLLGNIADYWPNTRSR